MKKYLWRTKDGDKLINVIGSLGIIDGREYLQIEGSLTGIPLDECVFIDQGNIGGRTRWSWRGKRLPGHRRR